MTAKTTRRRFLSQLSGMAVPAAVLRFPHVLKASEPRRPNFVFILADDLGYGDLGCYGCPDIITPAINRLAIQGVRFTNFYANAPECTPTRTALLTGRYQHRVGGLECALGIGNVGRYDDAIRLRETHDLGLPVEEISIARLLKNVGYATAICGKWHLGYEPKFFPLAHGFDYAFGPIGGGIDYHHHTEPDGRNALYLNGEPVRREGYITDLITGEAVRFINRQDTNPFFLYVPYNAPHTPYQVPNERNEVPLNLDNWNIGSRDLFAAMVSRMDVGIGRILKALEEEGYADNTVVIFASDNGANNKGRNLPFSGNKGQLFEGGIRVPCIVRWPGVLPAGTRSDRLSIMMDLTASMVRIAGAEPPAGRPFDGIDILQDIQQKRPLQKRTLFWRARRGERTWRAVRDGAMKYLSRRDGDTLQEYLFDLDRDPGERNNLLHERSDDLNKLKKLLGEWEFEVRPQR